MRRKYIFEHVASIHGSTSWALVLSASRNLARWLKTPSAATGSTSVPVTTLLTAAPSRHVNSLPPVTPIVSPVM